MGHGLELPWTFEWVHWVAGHIENLFAGKFNRIAFSMLY